MNINNPEYIQWLRSRNLKELSRRTIKKERKRDAVTRDILSKTRIKKAHIYNSIRNGHPFITPSSFSFIHDPEENINFFNSVIRYVSNFKNNGKKLFFDLSNIECLTIDALMYLLAIIYNIREKSKHKCFYSGNFPSNQDVLDLLANSGFLNYVKSNNKIPLYSDNEKIQIVCGKKIDQIIAKKICDFVIAFGNRSKPQCHFLYDMLIELMSNTKQHAYYNYNNALLNYWYIFVEHDENEIKFTFLDTGTGIPQTINKKFVEKIKMLNLKTDSQFIRSTLLGQFRTETRESHRGKGLPQIFKYYNYYHKFEKLKIISGKGTYGFGLSDNGSLTNSFQGTLFYWEIPIHSEEGE